MVRKAIVAGFFAHACRFDVSCLIFIFPANPLRSLNASNGLSTDIRPEWTVQDHQKLSRSAHPPLVGAVQASQRRLLLEKISDPVINLITRINNALGEYFLLQGEP